MKIFLIAFTLSTLTFNAEASSEEKLNKVHFRMVATDGIYRYPDKLYCLHKDILKKRPARNPVNPPVTTLAVVRSTAKKPEIFDKCQKDFANLTNLDQQKVRDDLGEILASMKCKPDHEILVAFNSFENNNLGAEYPGIRHNRIVNHIKISGCIDTIPSKCTFPIAGQSFNRNFSVVDYESMMASFKACRDAVNKYVEDNNMLEKWQAANDPNAKDAKGKAKHRNQP